ncbi:prepilin peptidase [Sphingomonas sp. BGYR3]|uniref:A24 family peptidase n=1 Tax=Sphingomonas sp. BGYR3 TaxID=2975483 RepID=UPI0021A5265D|nr:prepilin peptidase [Sphingomonas sp. BGYR3]MDG5489468.1 prepilin peptidase [Sphingomonas sp. BGYR3]
MGEYAPLVLVGILLLFLVSAGIEDLQRREIANWKNGGVALLAVPWWFAIGLDPWPDMAIQLALGFGTLFLFWFAFHLGMMGGGDVKMIAALALWLPVGALVWMLVLMSIFGGVLTLIMVIDHWRLKREGRPEIPYGVAIAAATLMILSEPNFYHFG